MKRKLYNALIEWKKDPDRKPLVLEGARQVGKTWLLKEFGQNEYQNLVYVNFHDDPEAQEIFRVDLKVDRIMYLLESITNQKITAGKTLIFMDEIQEAYRGLDSLKYFCENAREQHVVVAGSLLGTTHRKGESYPVGKVNLLTLYPMTFEEFLWAKGEEKIAEMLARADWEMLQILDSKVQELLRQYYYVGGMPEAVLQYTTKGDVNKVRRIHEEILRTYDNDFAKHAGDETERIRMVWESIPNQLAKENKKFIYGAVKEGGRARDFEIAIEWLVRAGLVYKIRRCKNPEMPLKFYEDFDAFKLYLLDVGLLGAMSKASPRLMLINNGVFTEFKGAFTENYVLEQLKSMDGLDAYYFSKDNSTQEVDFLVQTAERVIPIEVKAEENVKSKSLKQFVTVDHAEKNLKGLRCSMKPYIDQDWMENIPLYGVLGYINKQIESEK
ncbi:ATP-binding protein [Prevotella sp. E13-27]|uniref:ATP-binding protein n=1 Tax=Prevotella sp. E13-27 TaxID=2938122 RepID=UPI00200B7697|nr:ATP-binding protein [Prevotella sp. E13-27]MCK8623545.1 ATP-binding protein [Prevotella sp. E13-27]